MCLEQFANFLFDKRIETNDMVNNGLNLLKLGYKESLKINF